MTDIIETTEPEAPRRRQWPRDYGRSRPEEPALLGGVKSAIAPRTGALDVKEIGRNTACRRECP